MLLFGQFLRLHVVVLLFFMKIIAYPCVKWICQYEKKRSVFLDVQIGRGGPQFAGMPPSDVWGCEWRSKFE